MQEGRDPRMLSFGVWIQSDHEKQSETWLVQSGMFVSWLQAHVRQIGLDIDAR